MTENENTPEEIPEGTEEAPREADGDAGTQEGSEGSGDTEEAPREAEGDEDPEQAAEAGNESVRETVDDELDQGFRGTEADTTPNENYTVAGVTSGAPVPEAAPDPAVARREAHSQNQPQDDRGTE